MQINIQSNMKQIAASIKAKQSQIPYAAARSLNDLAFAVRQEIVHRTYPQSFQVKNQRFPGVLFRYRKATKQKLVAEIYDRLRDEGKSSSVYLEKQDSGGSKFSRSSTNVAIPVKDLMAKRNSQGRVPERFRPKNLEKPFKMMIKGNEYLVSRSYSKVTGKAKRGKGGQIKLYYLLKPRVNIGKNFAFYRTAMTMAKQNWQRIFTKNLSDAMKTAR